MWRGWAGLGVAGRGGARCGGAGLNVAGRGWTRLDGANTQIVFCPNK